MVRRMRRQAADIPFGSRLILFRYFLNLFGKETLAVKEFTDFEVKDGNLVIRMPACAVAEIRL